MSAPPDTHTESNCAHQKTSDSLYHCCFYFILIQNRHTLRNTNRCTHTHKHKYTHTHPQSTSDPKYLQNKQKTIPGFFFSSLSELSRQPETPGGMGYMAERGESNSNRPNLILEPHKTHTDRTHTRTCTHTKYIRAHKYGH